ncbi:hypothetical protein Pmani_004370 [Petrolisthes manimaculis]|uniref:Protein-tyrosine-phosphatase n=1 Tax=Petrolisthes manimaculis TaxID=1843537 RepID=A0AAE1UNC3_9EUCA|nr:hypothetical protein Pmani_004370 [Petrolisthes manimaculis]
MGLASLVMLLFLLGTKCDGSCRTFQEAFGSPDVCQSFDNYRCDSMICQPNSVWGSGPYHQDSDICCAARHAGVISLKHQPAFRINRNMSQENLLGTVRNRIVSKTRIWQDSEWDYVYEIQKLEQLKGVVGELVAVFGHAKNNEIPITCLTDNSSIQLTLQSIKSWSYEDIGRRSVYDAELSSSGSRLSFTGYKPYNFHAARCLGDSEMSDVLSLVQHSTAKYKSPVATVRLNQGESIDIPFENISNNSKQVYKLRLPDGWDPTQQDLPLHITSAKISDSGIYSVHETMNDGINAAYFFVSVRECMKDKYGIMCDMNCPTCLNGGVCHSQLGICICPPGFTGNICQFGCPVGWFGKLCQLRCDRETLNWDITQEGNCSGLTFCLPEPYSCSCAPGYYKSSCTQRCGKGMYGADCSQSCSAECQEEECHHIYGTCTHGCKPGIPCRKVPTTPEMNLLATNRGLQATWKHTPGTDALYIITVQAKTRISCNTPIEEEMQKHLVQNVSTFVASPLHPFTSYEFCLTTSITGGISEPYCNKSTTQPQAPSTTTLSHLQCWMQQKRMWCRVYENYEGCMSYNGANITVNITLQAHLACQNPHAILSKSKILMSYSKYYTMYFDEFLAGEKYYVTAFVQNEAGNGPQINITYTTTAKKPPPVLNLTYTIVSDSATKLKWNDPCPSNGLITSYRINKNVYTGIEDCDATQEYQKCYTIDGLKFGDTYTMNVQAGNQMGFSVAETVTFKLKEEKPNSPEVTSIPGDTKIKVTLKQSSRPGGSLLNCTIFLPLPHRPCIFDLQISQLSLDCEFNAEPGKMYPIRAMCCNSEYCSDELKMNVATKPLAPHLTGPPRVYRKTKTSVTLILPIITTEGEGKSFLALLVKKEGERVEQLNEEKAIDLWKMRPGHPRRKTREVPSYPECDKSFRIAGWINKSQTEFEVGDNNTYNGIYNCPLKHHQTYHFAALGVTQLLGEESFSFQVLEEGVVVEPYTPILIGTWASLTLFFLTLIVLFITFVYYRHFASAGPAKDVVEITVRDNGTSKTGGTVVQDDNKNEAGSTGIAVPNTVILKPLNIRENGIAEADSAVYANFSLEEEEDIYVNLTQQPVSLEEVQAYLNSSIDSQETSYEFMSVPTTLDKSMDVGILPANKSKNRYKNNLPYDDTRVKLSVVADDPHSDYINANHVPGYGKIDYIASQGPKDARVPTMKDFWRMVVEQDVGVIIMVANFVEGEKRKVGEYFKPEETLDFDGYLVSVTNIISLPFCTLSTLKVGGYGLGYQVQHYHYHTWPDHSVPAEPKSLAHMLLYITANYSHGKVLVHCSAGIGRTGTILQVFLMREMLLLKERFEPLVVLTKLRGCRARLVENWKQFNLALEIFDEITFGEVTKIPVEEFISQLKHQVNASGVQLDTIKALPSPLAFKSSTFPETQAMNRNMSVLPADSRRVILQMQDGLLESQYINAVLVPYFREGHGLLVTEHPLPITIVKFWRMVLERNCSAVILIHSFDQQSEVEFPRILPNEGEVWPLGDLNISTQLSQSYNNNFIEYTVDIINTNSINNASIRVVVYQVLGWAQGDPLSPSPDLLLTLADLVLQLPHDPLSGPPLLCCSDGYSGCGLVAAMALVVEQVQKEQAVDVYRTVVKLLRTRQHFITTQDQYCLLLNAAALYINQFSIYGNINMYSTD